MGRGLARRPLGLLVATLLLGLSGACLAGAAAEAAPRQRPPTAMRSTLGQEPARASGYGVLSPRRLETIKAALAGTATLLLLWATWQGSQGPGSARPRRLGLLRDALLLACGLLSLAAWWSFGRFHFDHYLHRSDSYVYFVGAKYFDELGYDGLYACTAVAEAQAIGADKIVQRPMRDLRSNRTVRAAAALAQPQRCLERFEPARWQAFRRDVLWFRNLVPPRQWRLAQVDHGYNATPVWGLLGASLANLGPASPGLLSLLSLLDPLWLAALWAGVVWAFGWRTACVAAVFWGTNAWAPFGWTGGGILRQDWLAASVLGICGLRRGYPALGGFALATAALLRIFPALLLASVGLGALLDLARRRSLRLSPEHARTALGAALALALLVPLSIWRMGAEAWPAFVENSRTHMTTPMQNHMGLPTLLSFHPERGAAQLRDRRSADPFAAWKQARRDIFAGRWPLYLLLAGAYALLLGLATARRAAWLAAALGVGAVAIAGELTSYYYSIFLAMGLLASRRPEVGAALCALALASWGVPGLWHQLDQIYTAGSALVLAFVVFATARFAWPGARGEAPLALSDR